MRASITNTWRKSGVYRITVAGSTRCYIGSAFNLGHRKHEHESQLRQGKHHSILLQRAWAKYGEDAFTFEVIEFVDGYDLTRLDLGARLMEREQYWLDERRTADGNNGYNILAAAYSSLGHKHSPEAVARMTVANRARAARGLTERQKAWYARKRGTPWTESQRQALEERRAQGWTDAERDRWERLRDQNTEQIRACSEARKGTKHKDSHRLAISEGNLRAMANDPTIKERRADGLKRAHARRTPEEKAALYAKIGAAQKGKIMSAESRAKMREARWRNLRKPLTPEHYEQRRMFSDWT